MTLQNTRISLERLLLLMFGSVLCLSAECQSITGKVTELDGQGLPFVNVLLLNHQDSALIKAAVTDSAGMYLIEKVHSGHYLLTASMVGYKKNYLPDIRVNDGHSIVNAPTLILASETTQLREVTVIGQRPFLEQKIDRTIVNVANSIIASGSSALEVLEKAPGVTIDKQNDQMQLRGKDGVIIQINGKQTYLANQDLVALLRGTASDNIDKIELITNPSSKFDAAGNSGIINIVMKKNNNFGTNGMVSIAGGTGRYGRGRGSVQVNHRNQFVSLLGNYGVNYNGNYFDLDTEREFTDGDQHNFATQNTFLRTPDLSQNAKAGLEYALNNNTSVGFLWTGFWNDLHEEGTAGSAFRSEREGPVYLDAETDKTIISGLSNQIANFSVQHKFGSKGGELMADVDVGRFHRSFSNNLITNTNLSDELTPSITGLLIEMPSSIFIYTLKSDYTRTVSKNWKTEMGIKFSSVRTENDLTISRGNEGLQPDPALANQFKFNEQITAGYINVSGKISEKIDIQAGLRIENTYSTANSITTHRVVNRDYLDFFPSLFISRLLPNQQTLTFSYSRRIDRPNYQNLNPGRSYVDPYLYFEGNPYLRPQYTHALEIKHSIDRGIFTSLGASFTNEFVSFYMQPVDSIQSQRTPVNAGQSQVYNATVSFPVTPIKQWTLQVSLVGIYARFQYLFLATSQVSEQLTARLNVSNAITVGKGWSAEFSGWLNAPAVNALYQSPWLGSVDAGVQKSIGSKWKAKLTLQDAFGTNQVRSTIDAAGFVRRARLAYDTRVIMLNLTYNFGNQKIKSMSQHKIGSEEELKRTN